MTYTCGREGGNLDVVLDYASIRATHSPQSISANPDGSVWRYQSLLPVGMPPGSSGALRTVGGTPFFRAERMEGYGAAGKVWIKDDTRMPTASLKDRASALVVAYALENGIERIITASTGNAGVALAGMAAAAGLDAVVVAPEGAPAAKVAQISVYGARLVLVSGSYSDAFDLTLQAAREMGWYCRNTGYNPLTVEGKKTVSYEICEQFTRVIGEPVSGRWVVPDRIIVPVGDGNIMTG
ncbi:MAG: pyridoxal-phosphate dependent enzyme, partial [Anaerolineales bacterium]|nr:pyridoxal-phosphate dependent enzyme [Anaerolineales bacterium]